MITASNLRPPEGSHKRRRRVGRGHGSGRVKTAGKGTKGQKARSGGGPRLGFEGGQGALIYRTPYLRGFKNPFKVVNQVVNLSDLARFDPAQGTVTLAMLQAAHLIDRVDRPVKLLASGDAPAGLRVQAHKCSDSARAKLEAAGGGVELVGAKGEPGSPADVGEEAAVD